MFESFISRECQVLATIEDEPLVISYFKYIFEKPTLDMNSCSIFNFFYRYKDFRSGRNQGCFKSKRSWF